VREEGSGARRLLERELRAAGIPFHPFLEHATFARGHLETAQAISMGAADFGIATRDAALAYDVDFVPIADERYDLVVPPGDLEDPRLERMFDVLTAWPLRREFAALGYDLSCSGERVAEIRAA
jgi:molybdate-binding protein